MSDGTKIEWTEATWNPTTGCDRVSPGCDRCYALTMAARLKAAGQPKYQRDGNPGTSGPGFGLTTHDDVLSAPLRWRKARMVFVNSMSDLFHEKVPDEFIARVFATMAMASRHIFQVLTKRHARMRSFLRHPGLKSEVASQVAQSSRDSDFDHDAVLSGPWPLPNVWLGVSVEDQHWADIRIPALLDTPAAVRWLSCEPLLGPVKLPFTSDVDGCTCYGGSHGHEPGCGQEPGPAWGNLHWLVCGGESGPGARPMHPDWARSLRDQCKSAGVPFFFKQWGGRTPKAGGRELDGRTWSEYPARYIPDGG